MTRGTQRALGLALVPMLACSVGWRAPEDGRSRSAEPVECTVLPNPVAVSSAATVAITGLAGGAGEVIVDVAAPDRVRTFTVSADTHETAPLTFRSLDPGEGHVTVIRVLDAQRTPLAHCDFSVVTEPAAPRRPARPAARLIGPVAHGTVVDAAYHPTDADTMIIVTDMGLAFRTTDGGARWQTIGTIRSRPFGQPGYRGGWCVEWDRRETDTVWIGSAHGIYKSTDAGLTWSLAKGGLGSAHIGSIAIDPDDSDVVYAAEGKGPRYERVSWIAGHVWKTVDGGATWTDVSPVVDAGNGQQWNTIAIDAESASVPGRGHQRLYLLGRDHLFVSEDAGTTWSSLNAAIPDGMAVRDDGGEYVERGSQLVLAPGTGSQSALLLALETIRVRGRIRGGVYRSIDGGRTWAARNAGFEPDRIDYERNWQMLAIHPWDANLLLWATTTRLFKSRDQGETWERIYYPASSWETFEDFDGRVDSWSFKNSSGNLPHVLWGAMRSITNINLSPSHPERMALSGNDGLSLSKDAGATWRDDTFTFGSVTRTYGRFVERFGSGRPPMRWTHRVRANGDIQLVVPNAVAVDPFEPRTIAGCFDDIGLNISLDDGTSWEWAYWGIPGSERRNNCRSVVYDPETPGKLFITTSKSTVNHGRTGVFVSTDGGVTFRDIGIPGFPEATEKVHVLAIDPRSPPDRRRLFVTTTHGLYRSEDEGASWTRTTSGLEAAGALYWIAIDPVRSSTVYVGTYLEDSSARSPGLYKSTDGGRTFAQIGTGRLHRLRGLSLSPTDPDVLYVLAGTSPRRSGWTTPTTLWKTTDGGRSWTALDSRPAVGIAVHPTDPRTLYYLSFARDVSEDEVALLRSTDGGATFSPVDLDVPLSLSLDDNKIVVDPRDFRVFLVTNCGLWEIRL